MKIWLSVFALLVLSKIQLHVHGEAQVPCFFIFGDSLADSGNNNLLPTEARANYQPYGVDYPSGTTGRFSNGRTSFDIIGELLGFENHIPPFTTANGSDILKGVNYASGSAGIRNETGQHLGAHISLDGQLKNHQVTVSKIAGLLGNNVSAATEYLNKCLYSVGMGNNDYINNYFLPKHYPTKRLYSQNQYAQVLIDQYSQQIKSLYNNGARKVVLFGVGRIGCTPNAISLHGTTNGSLCVDKMNKAVRHFNVKLKLLINQLNSNLTDAHFTYVNAYRMGSMNVSAFGFKVWNVGCCPVGENGQCLPDHQNTICKNRTEYLFWDSFHTTEAVNILTAARSFSSVDEYDAYPMDISHLAKL